MLGLDYAGSSPGAAAVKAAGYNFVARYLSRYAAKTIKQPEYDDMTCNGVGVVLVFEDYAAQALQGYAQGVADAQVALDQANALGWPATRPIHFAVDFDISDAQKPAAGEYMKGVASILGLARTGAYGGFYWIKYCADNNLAAPNARWQAVAWSGGQIHPSTTLFQRLGGVTVNGTSCDVNEAKQADFGQSNSEDDDMIQPADVYPVRVIMSEIEGWNADEVHSGKDDTQIMGFWTGRKWTDFIMLSWQGQAIHRGNLQSELDAANAQIKTLQDQINSTPAPAPTPDPVVVPDPPIVVTPPTPKLTVPQQSFLDWIKSIFGKK